MTLAEQMVSHINPSYREKPGNQCSVNHIVKNQSYMLKVYQENFRFCGTSNTDTIKYSFYTCFVTYDTVLLGEGAAYFITKRI